VEEVSNTSTVALRVVGGQEEGTQCLGVQQDHPLLGGYKYGDLAIHVGPNLSSERAPKLTGLQLSQKANYLRSHEPQMGRDTKTDRLTDRQS
jgi:hypothetical protein